MPPCYVLRIPRGGATRWDAAEVMWRCAEGERGDGGGAAWGWRDREKRKREPQESARREVGERNHSSCLTSGADARLRSYESLLFFRIASESLGNENNCIFFILAMQNDLK
jgi:hypothetical protein